MADECCCPPEAGSAVCEVPTTTVVRAPRTLSACPACGRKGKPVEGQTVKAMLSVSLRAVRETGYLFCRTPTCSTVYYTSDGAQTFTTAHIRERVYQKELEADDVLICYCFQHTAGEVRAAPPEARQAIVDDINGGIQAGQCACDLRNPQGSCCLGNMRALVKRLESVAA